MKVAPAVLSGFIFLNAKKGDEGSKGGAEDIILFPHEGEDKTVIFPGDLVIKFPR